MEPIIHGVVAGIIAALAVTLILGVARLVQQWWNKRRDVRYLRRLLTTGMVRVMSAKDTYHHGMEAWMKADALRAAQYTYLLKQVEVALERWTIRLSPDEKKDIYDALDWFNAEGLHAMKHGDEVRFVEVPVGKWPTTTMSQEHAERRLKKLQSISWLKMETE